MNYTCAQAAKLYKQLSDELRQLKEKEAKSCVFTASLGENIEEVRPSYDFLAVSEKIDEIERKIRIVKHAINSFNLNTEIPGTGMTVDQMLIYLPQLSEKKRRLTIMAARLPKERIDHRGASALVEYNYANYSIGEVEKALEKVTEELSSCQIALDTLNNTEVFEIIL